MSDKTADGALNEHSGGGRQARSSARRRVFVLGGTGSIGQATIRALLARGHEVVCFIRAIPNPCAELPERLPGAVLRFGEVTDPVSLARDGFRGERFDVVVSCMGSRTGEPKDSWAVEHRAHADALHAARTAGVAQFVLLSAICVQKPRLAFQQAKLAFERELIASGLCYSIVRPTAFFKSLSGQIERVKAGKPFVVFGDGRGTACKPISDDDIARYLVDCLDDPALHNRILPIGGPGPAITPREQGERLFALTGCEPRFRQVPIGLLDTIVWVLSTLGILVPALRRKAELARIARYYAGESMLVLDPETGRYDADMTPSTGTETLFAFYEQVLAGTAAVERGEHKVF